MMQSFIFKHIPTLLILACSALSCTGCSSLLYQPSREQIYEPTKLGLEQPEDRFFPSTDGTLLHAWYFRSDPKKQPKALIAFFHGNGENLSTHFASLAWILPFGYDFMIFDYRGYGRSQGDPSP